MKAPTLLLASLILVGSAHAHERFRFSGSINFYQPACPPPVAYCPPRAYYGPPPAYFAPAPRCEYPAPEYVPAPCPPRGYWRESQIQVWVPGRYVTQYDAYGCPVTCLMPGHYESRLQRVWINCGPGEYGP